MHKKLINKLHSKLLDDPKTFGYLILEIIKDEEFCQCAIDLLESDTDRALLAVAKQLQRVLKDHYQDQVNRYVEEVMKTRSL